MSDTQTTSSQQMNFTMPTGTDIYDALMADIDTDLLTVNIPHLEEKYASETEADRKKRLARYTKAYKAYDQAYMEWAGQLQKEVQQYKKHSLQSAEQKSRETEASELTNLELQFVS